MKRALALALVVVSAVAVALVAGRAQAVRAPERLIVGQEAARDAAARAAREVALVEGALRGTRWRPRL